MVFAGGEDVRMIAGALTSARARLRGGSAVLPDLALSPPLTPWPPLPTLDNGRRKVPTTTHDPDRGEADEYVVRTVEGPATVHGQRADGKALRTGARLGVGPHQLVFSREEFADHGRPYGGREGGERGLQRNQAPRSTGPRGPGDAL